MSSMGSFVSGFGHESLYLLAYLFEDLFDGPAFFFEVEVFFGKFDEYVNLIPPSLFLEQRRLHNRSCLNNVAVNAAKSLERSLKLQLCLSRFDVILLETQYLYRYFYEFLSRHLILP